MRELFKTYLCIVFCLTVFALKAQQFDTIYSKSNAEYVQDIKELSNGNYVIAGTIQVSANQYAGVLSIVDSLGNIKVNKSLIENGVSLFCRNIIVRSNRIIVFGDQTLNLHLQSSTDSVFIKIFDTNLNLQESHLFYFSDSLILGVSSVTVDHDRNIIRTGYSTIRNSVVRRPYIWKIDTNYNLVAKNDTMFFSWLSTFESTIDIEKDSSYYVFAMGMSGDYANMIMRFDYNLNYLSMDSTRFDLGPPYSPVHYRKNEIIHTGKNHSVYGNQFDYGVIVLDSSFNKKWFKQYRIQDTNQVPAMFNAVSKYMNNVFIGATYNSDYYFSNDTTWYQLTKMDTNYNVLWEKRFLGYTNDILTNVLATSDGGCLMAGWTHPPENTYYSIHLVKIDSNGTATWTQNIKLPQTEIRLYPNPVSEKLTLETLAPNQRLEVYRIYDLQGKELMQASAGSGQLQIDVSCFAAGAYIIEGRTTDGGRFRAKFVKR